LPYLKYIIEIINEINNDICMIINERKEIGMPINKSTKDIIVTIVK